MSTTVPARFLLQDLSWATYQALRTPEENYGKRMTYDRGELEIAQVSFKQGRLGWLIGLMIGDWLLIRNMEADFGGRTTLSREDLDCGLEPDHCFWIANVASVHGKDELDLRLDPPPDLVVEIDVVPTAINRLGIFQRLGVPEILRWHDERLEVLGMDGEHNLRPMPKSSSLVGFPIKLAEQLLRQRYQAGSMAILREFRNEIS